ncbi:glycosyltransferase family 4 protein [Helicobacter aurati]|uniref:Glycosyltransferase family 4 protein n=1 Tax=Helicobacter aurati TaxID=137778 RepID=A0A3D8J6Q4_9HELI|nr:glycosyltransferase [Helicobacter aurati]RDU73163.1 glycosyltransferase family 4 protein [Helicobacter aurati]
MEEYVHLFITAKDITESGGGERVGINLANALQENKSQKCKVTIISFYRANPEPIYPLHKDIQVIYLHCGKVSRQPLIKLFYKTIHRFFLSIKICLMLTKWKQDSQSIKLLANDGLFIPFFKVKGITYLRLWHMRAPKNARLTLRLFDILIILSRKEYDVWTTYHNTIKVIPNFLAWIPTKLRSPQKSKKRILSIGSMGKGDIKGFFRLVTIAKILQEMCLKDSCKLLENWEWVIIGNGILKQPLQRKIQSLGLESFVRIEDFRTDIESSYIASDICCLTSYSEGFSMVLLEASFFGLALVAFDICSGPSDVIVHEKSGFLIPDNDVEDFANKLLILMKDSLLLESMGQYAREYVSSKFSKEEILPLWLELLQK